MSEEGYRQEEIGDDKSESIDGELEEKFKQYRADPNLKERSNSEAILEWMHNHNVKVYKDEKIVILPIMKWAGYVGEGGSSVMKEVGVARFKFNDIRALNIMFTEWKLAGGNGEANAIIQQLGLSESIPDPRSKEHGRYPWALDTNSGGNFNNWGWPLNDEVTRWTEKAGLEYETSLMYFDK